MALGCKSCFSLLLVLVLIAVLLVFFFLSRSVPTFSCRAGDSLSHCGDLVIAEHLLKRILVLIKHLKKVSLSGLQPPFVFNAFALLLSSKNKLLN